MEPVANLDPPTKGTERGMGGSGVPSFPAPCYESWLNPSLSSLPEDDFKSISGTLWMAPLDQDRAALPPSNLTLTTFS